MSQTPSKPVPDIAPIPVPEGSSADQIRQYWVSVMRFKWLIAALTLLAGFASFLYISKVPDTFTATCSIVIEDIQTSLAQQSEVKATDQKRTVDYLNTQTFIAQGLSVMQNAAQRLDLKTYLKTDSDIHAAYQLRGRVSVQFVPKTRILNITVRDRDPFWAAKMANAVSESYIAETNRERLSASKQILEWFPDDTEAVRSGDPNVLLSKMNDPYFVESLPSIIVDQIIRGLKQDLISAEAKFSNLSAKYTNEHPSVRGLQENIDYLNRAIDDRTGIILIGLKRVLSGAMNINDRRIFELAMPPSKPSEPLRMRFVMMWTFSVLVSGIFGAISLGYLVETINSEEDLLQTAGMPYLGYVPLVQKHDLPIKDLLGNSLIFDAMTMLHTALLFSMPKDRNQLIMITSCVPNEGKSAFSAMMAHTMARIGHDTTKFSMAKEDQILLVECDIRRPSLETALDLSGQGKKGLADYLAGTAKFEEILKEVPGHPNLKIITSGRASTNPQSLFTSTTFDALLDQLRSSYTRVIFDAPPFLAIPEASIISQKVHGTIFVVSSGMLQRKALAKSTQKFKLLDATVFGIVLNRLEIGKKNYYYHGYYYAKGRPVTATAEKGPANPRA